MPCSICGNRGHNMKTCDGAEFLKDIKILVLFSVETEECTRIYLFKEKI